MLCALRGGHGGAGPFDHVVRSCVCWRSGCWVCFAAGKIGQTTGSSSDVTITATRRGNRRATGGDGRFTPTDVGNMILTFRTIIHLPVHPHGRGEHPRNWTVAIGYPGSPPRTWGTYGGRRRVKLSFRFTPTDVGNIKSVARRPSGIPVHPHGRGEHGAWNGQSRNGVGSPPRTWGTCGLLPDLPADPRFTPTDVGNICSSRSSSSAMAVHPHGRGEHRLSRWVSVAATGSPPRTWGTCQRPEGLGERQRFTPTDVGNILDITVFSGFLARSDRRSTP